MRYADDFVVLCKHESQCKEALRRVKNRDGTSGAGNAFRENAHGESGAGGKEGFMSVGPMGGAQAQEHPTQPTLAFREASAVPEGDEASPRPVHEITDVRGRQSQDIGELIES